MAAMALGSSLLLSGCGGDDEAKPSDVTEEIDQKAEEGAEKVDEGTDEVEEETGDAGEKAEELGDEAKEKTE